MIEIRDLEFQYGDAGFRLCIPRLTVEHGEKVAIVGSSGSGKTTLLMLLAGVLMPDRGTVRVAGTLVSSLNDSERRRFRMAKLGFVFQELELIEYLSAAENILLPYLIHRHLKLDGGVREWARDLANALGLSDKLRRFPGRLSQGERQRVAICRALVTRPPLVLADEPTGNLDPDATQSMLRTLLAQAQERGATILMVTHNHLLLPQFDRTIDLANHHAAASLRDD